MEKIKKKSEFSVLDKAAMYYAGDYDVNQLLDIQKKIISKSDVIPFQVYSSDKYSLHIFSPRLRLFLEDENLKKLWDYLSCRENIIRMIAVTEVQRPAVEAFSDEIFDYLRQNYEEKDAMLFKQNVGYMIKIIMEMFGYVVDQKKVNILRKYNNTEECSFKNASRYRKMREEDFQTDNGRLKGELLRLYQTIITNSTVYQKQYQIDKKTSYSEISGENNENIRKQSNT